MLRVHGHERTHSCVLRSGVRYYIINGQKCGTHLDHTSLSSLASSSSSLMLMKFHWRTGAASTGGGTTQRVLGNESEQRETTTKKDALMNTGPRKKKAPKMEERGGSAGQAWCSKKSVSKAKMVNKKRKRDANGGRSRRRHRGDGPAWVGCAKLGYEEPSHLRQGRGGSDRRATTKATL